MFLSKAYGPLNLSGFRLRRLGMHVLGDRSIGNLCRHIVSRLQSNISILEQICPELAGDAHLYLHQRGPSALRYERCQRYSRSHCHSTTVYSFSEDEIGHTAEDSIERYVCGRFTRHRGRLLQSFLRASNLLPDLRYDLYVSSTHARTDQDANVAVRVGVRFRYFFRD